ncbi:hypothetical protein [Phenylobacterium sp.]|uniref:COG3650 family protein n=1 Tax=Phenylobacterium sp. TaxID=1871053 RepID=UPI00301D78E8
MHHWTDPLRFGLLLAGATLALVACQPPGADGVASEVHASPDGQAAPKAAASVGMDISQPIMARGTEPFWAIRVTDGRTLTYSAPGETDRVYRAEGATVAPGRATWIAHEPGGEQLTLTVYASDCSDGMSDLDYPWVAEAALPNRRLHGCAGKEAEMPREGG